MNNKYGFGVLDTAGLVNLAMDKNWVTAEEQHICRESGDGTPHVIPRGGTLTVTLESTGCASKPECVVYLEHVRVFISLDHSHRGALSITLTSPSGTKSEILKQRSQDYSIKGFQNWPFMTVFAWGENPGGTWKLEVTDHGAAQGTLKKWSLRLYGTCTEPKPNITKSENHICQRVCKKGCPLEFATSCKNCSQYCHCDTGECVKFCDEDDEIDQELKHCLPPNTFTKIEKSFCQKNCRKCPKTKFCDCHSGKCISSCGHDDKVDAKNHLCISTSNHNNDYGPHDHPTVDMTSYHKWLVIFSLIVVFLIIVIFLYVVRARELLCWSRPAKSVPQRNVSYRPVALDNIEPPVRVVPPEREELVQSNA